MPRLQTLSDTCAAWSAACCDPDLAELLKTCAVALAHRRGDPCMDCHELPAEVGPQCRPCYQSERRAARICTSDQP